MNEQEQDWIELEFQCLEINDKRLDERARKIVRDLSARPNGSILEFSESWAATKAAYHFFSNESKCDRHSPDSSSTFLETSGWSGVPSTGHSSGDRDRHLLIPTSPMGRDRHRLRPTECRSHGGGVKRAQM
jgi:hypothetical protein